MEALVLSVLWGAVLGVVADVGYSYKFCFSSNPEFCQDFDEEIGVEEANEWHYMLENLIFTLLVTFHFYCPLHYAVKLHRAKVHLITAFRCQHFVTLSFHSSQPNHLTHLLSTVFKQHFIHFVANQMPGDSMHFFLIFF